MVEQEDAAVTSAVADVLHAAPAHADMAPILVVDHSSKLAGAELVLLDIARGFGPGSTAFLFEDGPLRAALRQRGIAVRVSPRAGNFAQVKRDRSLARCLPHVLGMAAVVGELTRLARRHTAVYANSQKAFVLASLAAVLARRPLVWHLHDILSPAHFGAAQRRLVVTLANRLAACVIVPSAATATAFITAGGKASLVRVVANGLDIAPPREEGGELREALGLPAGFLFGVFSRLAPWKGQHVALEALAQLPGAHCLMAGAALFGEDAYARHLHDLAARLGVADRVMFLGQRNDVPRLMRAVDVVVHPSVDPEPFGRTLVEAMLCRVPVIASAAGAAGEILDEGRAGWLVPPGDGTALAAALRAIMGRSAAVDAIIDQAEQRARCLYTSSRMLAGVRAAVGPLLQPPFGRHGDD